MHRTTTKPPKMFAALSDVSNTHQSLLLYPEKQHDECQHHSSKTDACHAPQQQQAVVVTSSGFRGAAKQQLQHLASQFGASYSGQLVQGHTTHLVCKRLIDCFATPKYQCALQWGIHVVSYEWLTASAAAGKPLPEQDFQDDAPDALNPTPAPPRHQQQHWQQQQHRQYSRDPQLQTGAGAHTQQGSSVPQQVLAHQEQQQQQQEQQRRPLFTFGDKLPANFLLLGSDSPRSEDSDRANSPSHFLLNSPSHFLLSQPLHHQQDAPSHRSAQSPLQQKKAVPLLPPSPTQQQQLQQQHACAFGDCTEGGFQFSRHSQGLQQATSPCVHSFLPMQQQHQQPEAQLLPGQLLGHLLEGSELQPEGMPEAAAATAALGGDNDTAGAPAAAATAAPAAAAKQGEEKVPQQLLIPETQIEDFDVTLCGTSGDTAAACGGRHPLLHPPCRTPDSLAHYASKQRRRQQGRAQAFATLGGGGRSRPAHQQQPQQEQLRQQRSEALQEGQQKQQGQQQQGCLPDAAAGTQTAAAGTKAAAAAEEEEGGPDGGEHWPPSWLHRAAAARAQGMSRPAGSSCAEDTPPASPAAAAAAGGEALAGPSAAPAAAVKHMQDSRTSSSPAGSASGGRSSSSSESPEEPLQGFVRLRRRDGFRGQAGARVLLADSPLLNPEDDMEDLQDSDCELADASDSSGSSSSGNAHNSVSDARLLAAGGDRVRARSKSGSSSSSRQQEQQGRGAAAAALPAAFASTCNGPTRPKAPAAGHVAYVQQQQRSASRQQQQQRRQGTAAVQLLRAGAASPSAASCSGSSCPVRRQPRASHVPAAAAAATTAADVASGESLQALDDAAAGEGSCATEDDSCSAAATPAAAAAAPTASAGGAASGGFQGGESVLTDCSSSQGPLPIMRLKFSCGGRSSSGCLGANRSGADAHALSSPFEGEGTPQQGWQQQQQHQCEEEQCGQEQLGGVEEWEGGEAGWDEEGSVTGGESEDGTELSEGFGEVQSAVADAGCVGATANTAGVSTAATAPGCDDVSDYGEGRREEFHSCDPMQGSAAHGSTLTTGSSSSRRSTGSSGSSKGKLRLRQGAAAAAAAAGGTAATAAALLQKRQQLKQQQQQGIRRPQLVTPPSEQSQFVTRRRCPKPVHENAVKEGPAAAAAATAAASAVAAVADDNTTGCARVCDPEAAFTTAPADSTDTSEDEQQPAAAAAAAAAPPAEQLLRDLHRQQQQQQPAEGHQHIKALSAAGQVKKQRTDKAHKQQQQQPPPAEAFLQDLRKRQQQQQQATSSGDSKLAANGDMLAASNTAATATAAAAAASEVAQEGGAKKKPMVTMVAKSRAAPAGSRPARHSVSSSSAVTHSCSVVTHASTASAACKVPLELQAGAIVLHSCSGSSSSASGCAEGGLHQALQQLLATPHDHSRQQQQQQHLQEEGVFGGVFEQGGDRAYAGGAETGLSSTAAPHMHAAGAAAEAQEGHNVSWLHTPEDPQQQHKHQELHTPEDPQQQEQQQQGFDLSGMPTAGVAARGGAMSKHLGARLAQMSQTQEEVIPLKLLVKAPRGSTAKSHHGLKPNSKVTYAEQVQVPWAHATFSTKERSRCVILSSSGDSSSEEGDGSNCSGSNGSGSSGAFVAEPVAFYKLSSGEWWVELLRFYCAKDLRELAKAAQQPVHLPPDFQLSYELVRGLRHEHWPMRRVQGEFKLSKVRKAPPGGRSRGQSPFFWRYSVDPSTCQLLTDRPVTDFVLQ